MTDVSLTDENKRKSKCPKKKRIVTKAGVDLFLSDKFEPERRIIAFKASFAFASVRYEATRPTKTLGTDR